jgi:hypothetical protein
MAAQLHDTREAKAGGTTGRRIAALFGLERDDGWERHANPASVWTRFAALPLLIVAIWSREWIGWWSLVPTALAVAWVTGNPVFFSPPHSTRNWASQGVLGERIFVHRDTTTIPPQYATRVPHLIQVLQAVGLVPLVYGLVELDPTTTVLGLIIVQGAKLWYLDRMVLLFNDVKCRPEYAAWDHDEPTGAGS